jgi:hypothetical protein
MTLKPTSGSSTLAGVVVRAPMVASASALVTRLHASAVPAAVPGAAVAPDAVEVAADAAALAPADADGFADVSLLAEGAALALDPASDELGRAEAVAELVPRAAGDPLEPPVVVDGWHAMVARNRTEAISVVLMTEMRRKECARNDAARAVHRLVAC